MVWSSFARSIIMRRMASSKPKNQAGPSWFASSMRESIRS